MSTKTITFFALIVGSATGLIASHIYEAFSEKNIILSAFIGVFCGVSFWVGKKAGSNSAPKV